MAQLRELVNNLSTGKISKSLRKRFDVAAFRSACTNIVNYMPLLEGGIRRRPGSTEFRNLDKIDTEGVSFDFNFDSDEAYVVYLTSEASGCRVTDQAGAGATVNFTLGTVPWSAFTDAQMEEINFTQSGDVMVIVHQNFEPVVLRRTSLSTFDLDYIPWENDKLPFFKHGALTGTMRVNALTAGPTTADFTFTVPASWLNMRIRYQGRTVEITSTGATTVNVTLDQDLPTHYQLGAAFAADHRSELESMIDGEEISIQGLDSVSSTGIWISSSDQVFSSNTELKTDKAYDLVGQTSGTLISIRPVFQGLWSAAIDEEEDFSGPNGRILVHKSEPQGGLNYDTYVDDVTGKFASGDVLTGVKSAATHTLPGTLAASMFSWGSITTTTTPVPNSLWTEQAFSGYAGYPSAVAFHQDRLWLGGSILTPNLIAGSVVGAPYEFNIGDALDDEAIVAALRGDQIPRIHHLHSSDNLVVLTDRSEGYIPSVSSPITPATVRHLSQTRYGCSLAVRPVQLGGTILFVQNDRRTIRQLVWEDAKQRYTAALLSTFVRDDLTGIRQMSAIPAGPTGSEEFVFVVNGDGSIMCFIGSENDNISGFFPWNTGFGVGGGYKTANRVVNDLVLGVKARVLGGTDLFVYLKMDETKTVDWAIESTNVSPADEWEGSGLATSLPNYTDHPYSQEWEDFGITNLSVQVVAKADDQNGDGEIPAYYLGDFSMHDTNTITLPTAHQKIEYGVGFVATATPTPWLIELDNGVKNIDPYSVVRAVVNVSESLDLKINGKQALTSKANLTNLDQSIVYSVDGDRTVWGNGWAVDDQITLENDLPLPCTVLSITVEVEF